MVFYANLESDDYLFKYDTLGKSSSSENWWVSLIGLIGASFEVLVNCHGDTDRLNYPILIPIIIKMIEKNL